MKIRQTRLPDEVGDGKWKNGGTAAFALLDTIMIILFTKKVPCRLDLGTFFAFLSL